MTWVGRIVTWVWRIVTLMGLFCLGVVIYRAGIRGDDETLGYTLVGLPALGLGARDAWRTRKAE